MKKLILTFVLALCSICTWADDALIDGIYYTLDTSTYTATVTRNGSYSGDVAIPESVVYGGETYSVTSIGNYVFLGCTGLTSVTIPESVTSIGEGAFRDCSGLTSVTIPSSVTSIGNNAFGGCTSLTSVTIPNSVTSIGSSAFNGCTSLTAVTIGNSVTSIGEGAFYGCTGLTSVTIPNSVTSIGYRIFIGCLTLSSIIVEEGNTVYDSRDNCNAIIETASNTLIQGCKNTIIPETVTSIAESAFTSCSGLASVTIPESVTSIGNSAFSNCTGLTSVTIGNSVTSIGIYAFYDCTGLTSVTLGNSMTSTGEYTFYGCTGLTSVTIPNSVTSIGGNAFYGCSGLASVTIGNSVMSIGRNAFYNCSGLTSVTIPESVTSIGSCAFGDCSGLRKVYSDNPTPPTCSSGTFNGVLTNHCKLYVPSGSVDDYAFSVGWGDFINIEVKEEPVVSITLDKTSLSLGVGETETITATITPDNATNKNVEWSSSDTTVATVKDGVVTALNPGSATITATSTDGTNISEKCEVTVNSIPAESISISAESGNIEVGQTLTLIATVLPENTSYKDVEWSSSDTSIATVKNGVVRGVAAGNVVVSVRTTDGTNLSASCSVEVKPMSETDISTLTYAVYATESKGIIGKTVNIPVNLKNENAIATWQADLVLPTGFTIATDSYGDPMIVISGDRTTTSHHAIATSTLSSGATRILYNSSSNKTITGTDGEVATITLNIADDVEEGDYPIILNNEVMSETNETGHKVDQIVSKISVQNYTPGDVSNDGEINASDLVAVVNYILENPTEGDIREAADLNEDGNVDAIDYVAEVNLILSYESSSSAKGMAKAKSVAGSYTGNLNVEPFTIAAGNEQEVVLSMTDTNADYTCCQFDVVLPEGITVEDAESMMGSHSVAFRTLDSGATRVLVSSMANKKMTSNDLVRLTLKADADMMEGSYDLNLDNALLVTPQGDAVSTSAVCPFTVGNATGINLANDNDNDDDKLYNIAGQRVNRSAKGIIIVNGKKEYVK